MIKRKYAKEHDISPLSMVKSVPLRIPLISLYSALRSVIEDGFSETVSICYPGEAQIYKSIEASVSNFALFIKTLLYHVHGEEKIEISISTGAFDAHIDIKCSYKFTKDEISDLEAAISDSGFEFTVGEYLRLTSPLRACGAVSAYAFGTDPLRHYIYYVIHSDLFMERG